MLPYRFSQHSLDIIFKLEAAQLGTALRRRFGISLPPIVRHFPTELPIADVHLEQLDTVFELADTDLLHLEFQTIHRRETLRRFLQYDVGLYALHGRRIHTVVIYGAGITTAEEMLDCGAVQYRVTNVFLGREDGEQAYRRLRARVEAGVALGPEERLDLVFLPLMQHQRPTLEIVSDALALARHLPDEEQQQTLAALIGLGQRFLSPADLDALLEGLMATNIGQRLLERGFERGFEVGREQGLELGRELGREQGLELGRITATREALITILTRRFGALPPPMFEQILCIGESSRLDELLDAALAANSLEEFAQALS